MYKQLNHFFYAVVVTLNEIRNTYVTFVSYKNELYVYEHKFLCAELSKKKKKKKLEFWKKMKALVIRIRKKPHKKRFECI